MFKITGMEGQLHKAFVEVPPEIAVLVEEMAAKFGLTDSQVVREAVSSYAAFNSMSKEDKEELRRWIGVP